MHGFIANICAGVLPELREDQVGRIAQMILQHATMPQVSDQLVQFGVKTAHSKTDTLYEAIKGYLAAIQDDPPSSRTPSRASTGSVDGRSAAGTAAVNIVKVGAKRKASESKAPSRKAQSPGAKVGSRKSQGTAATLGLQMSSMQKDRLPKPRSKVDTAIDEIIWSKAYQDAEESLQQKFSITKSWEEYYDTMCTVGQTLLAESLHTLTQKIYDYRASKKQSRENKKLKM